MTENMMRVCWRRNTENENDLGFSDQNGVEDDIDVKVKSEFCRGLSSLLG